MRSKLIYIVLFFSFVTPAFAQQSFHMRVLSNFNNPNLNKVDATDIWNDLTGYYDAIKNREYIIAGSTDSIYFFDITKADSMKLIDVRFGKSFYARNRDYETYSHYAYCVSDQASGIGAIQIFDLQYLPDSVHKVYESNALGTFIHTIFIDSLSKRMYLCSNTKPGGFAAMDVLSLANPEQPTFLASLNVPQKNGTPIFSRVHEMYARGDTAYLSCEYAGLFVFDMRNLSNQIMIGSITSYPDQGYNHSSWLDKTGRYIMFTDETTGMDAKIFDIKDLANPIFVSQFNSNSLALPHNAFWYGNFAYVSAYHDGVRVYNIADPGNPIQVAWYDTHPETPEVYGGYKGCWGVYPFLPSKHIIASDLTSGIFVFEIDSNLVGLPPIDTRAKQALNLYPNPSHDWVEVDVNTEDLLNVSLTDITGKVLLSQTISPNQNKINISQLALGTYLVHLSNENRNQCIKLIKW